MGALVQERFELIRTIGAGAFGTVYEAKDLAQQGASVAIKVLHSMQEDLARFQREARTLAALDHPGIVRYVDHGFDSKGHAYLAMEWLEGQTLEERLERGALPLREAVQLGRRIAEALESALVLNAVHRDLKPANLFLPQGEVTDAKILDFGLVRTEEEQAQALTQTGTLLGTPAYMSPEQAHGEQDVTFRSDVFALGVVLYEALTGRLPFNGASPMATLMKICVEEPERVESYRRDTPAELGDLIGQMLAKDPAQRPDYAHISQTLTALLTQEAFSLLPEVLSIGPSNDGGPLPSLRARAEQRVLCALFVGPGKSTTDRLEAHLSQLFFDCGGYGHRLLDGTRMVMLDGHLAASDQAVAAAQCAVEMQRLLPESSMALCTGRAVVGEATPVGELIDRGAALLRRTRDGAVSLDEDSASLLAARYRVRSTGAMQELGSERPASVDTTNPESASTFVGREAELGQLQALVAECLEDASGRAVLVTAPAGAGKSALGRQWRRRLRSEYRDGLEILVGRGDSVCQGVRFGVLRPALRAYAGMTSDDPMDVQRDKLSAQVRQLLPGETGVSTAEFLGEMLGLRFPDDDRPSLRAARRDPQLMADWVLNSWLTWIEAMCQRKPLVFVVEDLHWADPGSVRFLDAALRIADSLPLLVAAFARPEVHENLPKLWSTHEVHSLRLRKLGTRLCDALLAARLGSQVPPEVRARLIDHSDGNPFFLEELARAYLLNPEAPDLPSSVLGTLQVRLDALGDDAKLLLRAASVYGQSFNLQGVLALLHGHTARVDVRAHFEELERASVIQHDADRGQEEYSFRHALIGDAAYRLLTDEDRSLGHRLAARWLETRDDTPPALLAEHYERGECPEQAATWYSQAALQAMEGGTMQEVVRLGERAVGCGAQGEALGETAALVAEAHAWGGDVAQAQAWAERARAALRPTSSGWWRATQVLAIEGIKRSSGHTAEFVDELLGHATDPSLPAQVAALAGTCIEAYYRSRSDIGDRIRDGALIAIEGSIGGRSSGYVEMALSADATLRGDVAASLAHARLAADAFRESKAFALLAGALNDVGTTLNDVGQFDRAREALREALEASERCGSEQTTLILRVNLAVALREQGKLQESRTELEAVVRSFRCAGNGLLEAGTLLELAKTDLAGGESGAARTSALAVVEKAAHDPIFESQSLAILSQVSLQAKDAHTAHEHACQALGIVREHGLKTDVGTVWVAAIEAAIAVGDLELAAELSIQALDGLQERAQQFTEPELRASFLENVVAHRTVRELAQKLASTQARGPQATS